MESTTLVHIKSVKKQLTQAITESHYDLLSPEILRLSEELDQLMLPLFVEQLNEPCDFHS